MAIFYDNHFAHSNHWQHQRIHSNYYARSSFKSAKVSSFDLKDHEKAIKSNNIPIWICSRCTFRNIQRKSRCCMCDLSYKSSKSTSYEREPTHCARSKELALGDFCSNIVNQVNEHIPVWICTQCTYCNIEQLSLCQMCNTAYAPYKQEMTVNVLVEQQAIINSVQCKKEITLKECEVIPKNISNGTSVMSDLQKRRKYTKRQLLQIQKPTNVLDEIPHVFPLEIKDEIEHKQVHMVRRQWNISQLINRRYAYKEMPSNLINSIPEILSPGLGLNIEVRVRRRKKFTLDELMSVRFEAGYNVLPVNIINDEPQILCYGLGIKNKMKS